MGIHKNLKTTLQSLKIQQLIYGERPTLEYVAFLSSTSTTRDLVRARIPEEFRTEDEEGFILSSPSSGLQYRVTVADGVSIVFTRL